MSEAQLLQAIAGGALIGLSAGFLFLVNGRIAGVSGFFGDALANPKLPETASRVLFLVGLVAGYLLVRHFVAGTGGMQLQVGWGGMVLAGLLVGYGTRLGCGCTSGHGICGIGGCGRKLGRIRQRFPETFGTPRGCVSRATP